MNRISPTELHTLLKNSVVIVTFTKIDGTERKMQCTLQESYLPEHKTAGHLIGESGAAHFSVWDVENKGWRSFRLESIKSVVVNGVEYNQADQCCWVEP